MINHILPSCWSSITNLIWEDSLMHLIMPLSSSCLHQNIFMKAWFYNVVDVKRDGNFGYQVISTFLGKGEENHTCIHHQVLKELKV